MKKIVKIGNTEYSMKSSAYTQFKYKDETGRSLVKDLTSLGEKFKGLDKDTEVIDKWEDLEDFLMMTLKIAYIMTNEADSSQAANFDMFLKQIDGYMNNINWFGEVVELALNPLSGQV